MKIRIIKKENPDNVGVVDLAKAAAVHYDPVSRCLEIYSAFGNKPARYPEELCDFQYVEISMSGVVHYNSKTAQQVVELYSMDLCGLD